MRGLLSNSRSPIEQLTKGSEPCEIPSNTKVLSMSESNRVGKAAFLAARRFARSGQKGKPDIQILRALMSETSNVNNVKKIMGMRNESLREQIDSARAVIVTDVSGELDDEIQIMITMS